MDGVLLFFLLLLTSVITIGVVLYIIDNKKSDEVQKTTEIQYVLTPSTYYGWNGWNRWNDYYGWNYGKHRRRRWH